MNKINKYFYRTYIIDKIYKWINLRNLTPYILVDVYLCNEYILYNYLVDNNHTIINISSKAIHNYNIEDDFLEFDATFNSELYHIIIPIISIKKLYSKESGEGFYINNNNELVIIESNDNNYNKINNKNYFKVL